MKKTLAVVILLLLVVAIIVVMQYKKMEKEHFEVAKYNALDEEYNKQNLNGLDITTIINKAVNNNEKNNVEKENIDGIDFYKDNGTDSVIIEINMIINGKTYRMEQINSLGLDSFTEYFAEVKFDCTEVKYHEETGKVSYMLFNATQY